MQWTSLISVSELAQLVKQNACIVFDCRHDLTQPDLGRELYAQGHIPGAHFLHLDTDLSQKFPLSDERGQARHPQFLGRHPLPDPEKFLELLRAHGVNDDTQIIAYDDQGGMFAARLWWMCRWLGHTQVAVLDGGLSAWKAEQLALSQAEESRTTGQITRRTALVATVNANDIVQSLDAQTLTVVDARAPDRFRGENETLDPVGGHIPGARNRFFKDNLNPQGRFKTADVLRAEWEAILQDRSLSTTVMQCGSGVTACHNLLALDVAGLSGAALYPGSWSQWCADPQRPVATGVSES